MPSSGLGALDGEVAEEPRGLEYTDQDHHPHQEPKRFPIDRLDGLLLTDGPCDDEQQGPEQGRRRSVNPVQGEHGQHREKDRECEDHHPDPPPATSLLSSVPTKDTSRRRGSSPRLLSLPRWARPCLGHCGGPL